MLAVLSEANNSHEFASLIPKAWKVLDGYVSLLRTGRAELKDLVIEKNLSKMPNEYTSQVLRAIAANQLIEEGKKIHAGQHIAYIITRNKSSIPENRALSAELADQDTNYDSEAYVKLLLSSAMGLFPSGSNLPGSIMGQFNHTRMTTL